MATGKRQMREEVIIHEFETPKEGYRARLLAPADRPRCLDLREYLDGSSASGFVGFTRKGVRLVRAEAEALAKIIDAALKAGL